MPRPIHVHLLPALVEPGALVGAHVVVVDVLRASTTICHALAAGATRVVPVAEVDEARRLKEADPDVRLGGERGGELIDGFDLGNSPTAYTPETIGGRTLVFTTTNGTRALLHASRAARIVVGCFANEATVRADIERRTEPVHILCAGTNGEITAEDVLFAGSLAASLDESAFETANDSAQLAVAAHERCVTDGSLLDGLRNSRGGRNLQRLGFDADIATAATRDSHDVLPVFDPAARDITAARNRLDDRYS